MPATVMPIIRSMTALMSLTEAWIVSRSYAPRSAHQRRILLARLARHCPPDIRDLDARHLLDWWAGTEHLAPASRRAHHITAATFLAWCAESTGVDLPDVATLIRRPKVPRSAPTVLTDAQRGRLLATPMTPRERLLVLLMLDLGLRSVDCAGLSGDDIDHDAGTVTIRGKGGHVDVLPLPSSVAALLGGPTVGQLAPRSADTVRTEVTGVLRRAGIPLTPHALRRTFATGLVESGRADVRTVQALLRHVSLGSTDRYIAGPALERMRSAVA